MSDTPETNLMLDNQFHDAVQFDDACDQLAELCRKLERERDELREDQSNQDDILLRYMDEIDEARGAFAIATDQCTVAYSKLREAIAERDEARAMLDQRWQEEGTPLVKMIRERDEARKSIMEQKARKARAPF
jgi:AAA+ superfamily predicted ATPase